MSKRTGNRDGLAAEKRRKRHAWRMLRGWRALVVAAIQFSTTMHPDSFDDN